MENEAFDLVRRGARDEARAILSSDQDEVQKGLYADGMKLFDQRLKAAVQAALRSPERKAFLHIPVGLVVIALLLACWLVMLRAVRAWERACLRAITYSPNMPMNYRS
jgi:sensor c-di-GMP phosphodiesterase-like protein